jgi:hypothetical protein
MKQEINLRTISEVQWSPSNQQWSPEIQPSAPDLQPTLSPTMRQSDMNMKEHQSNIILSNPFI